MFLVDLFVVLSQTEVLNEERFPFKIRRAP